ncbi:MAG TPA: glycosyltransferase family 9 protein [Candidatus Acidoferrales bacterium]
MPAVNDQRFLLLRLGSLGDIVHALPAASALRDTFPESRIDWAVEPKWVRLLEGNPDLNTIVKVDRKTADGLGAAVQQLRAAKYTCAIDFQGLYKSSLLAFASGAPRRIGFRRTYAREGFASWFYTDRLNPRGAHKVEHNLTLAEAAGARRLPPRFPIVVRPEDEALISAELARRNVTDFFVLNPGGGWGSKCWPAERYGELHRKIFEQFGLRGVVSYGPGEDDLAQAVIAAAGNSAPVAVPLDLGPLMALLQRAQFVVSADTGPLHLAAALKAPVVGLFGPTDPARNGPYIVDPSQKSIIVRNPRLSATTYQRGASYSPAMLAITVAEVAEAVQQILGTKN